jgi:hypothetical protein
VRFPGLFHLIYPGEMLGDGVEVELG